MIEYTARGVTCATTCSNVNQQWLSVKMYHNCSEMVPYSVCKHSQYDNPEETGHGHMIATIH